MTKWIEKAAQNIVRAGCTTEASIAHEIELMFNRVCRNLPLDAKVSGLHVTENGSGDIFIKHETSQACLRICWNGRALIATAFQGSLHPTAVNGLDAFRCTPPRYILDKPLGTNKIDDTIHHVNFMFEKTGG